MLKMMNGLINDGAIKRIVCGYFKRNFINWKISLLEFLAN